jgi:hypothetical protein
MKRLAALFRIVLALGAIILAPWASTHAQHSQQEGPIEIENCQTIDQPGSYKLVKNLTITSTAGTCLSITASSVAIDLAGFTIIGPGPQQGSLNTQAIAAGNDTDGITVRNGSISGFRSGVVLNGFSSIVEGLHVRGPCGTLAPTCELGIAAMGIVRSNTVEIFAFHGGGTHIAATGIVSGNYVLNSDRDIGIAVGQGSTVIGNTVRGDGAPEGETGLSVNCPSNVTNNTAVNNPIGALANPGGNLVLNGSGCNNTNNVAP